MYTSEYQNQCGLFDFDHIEIGLCRDSIGFNQSMFHNPRNPKAKETSPVMKLSWQSL